MRPGLVIDHDIFDIGSCEDDDPLGAHAPGCPCRAGGDVEYVTTPLSLLRCSECGDLLDGYGSCSVHGLLDMSEARDGD